MVEKQILNRNGDFFTKAPISFQNFRITHCKTFSVRDLPSNLTMRQAFGLARKMSNHNITKLNQSDLLLARLRRNIKHCVKTTFVVNPPSAPDTKEEQSKVTLYKHLRASQTTLSLGLHTNRSRSSWSQLAKLLRTTGRIDRLVVGLAPIPKYLPAWLHLTKLAVSKNNKHIVEVSIQMLPNPSRALIETLINSQEFLQFTDEYKVYANLMLRDTEEYALSKDWFSPLEAFIECKRCMMLYYKDKNLEQFQYLDALKKMSALCIVSQHHKEEYEGSPLYGPVKIHWSKDFQIQTLRVLQNAYGFASVFNSTFPFQKLKHLHIKMVYNEIQILNEHLSQCSQLETLDVVDYSGVSYWLETTAAKLQNLPKFKVFKIETSVAQKDAKVLTDLGSYLPKSLETLSLKLQNNKAECNCKIWELIDSVFSFPNLKKIELGLSEFGLPSKVMWKEEDLIYLQSKLEKLTELRSLEMQLNFSGLSYFALKGFISALDKKFFLGDVVKINIKIFDEGFQTVQGEEWISLLKLGSYSMHTAEKQVKLHKGSFSVQ